MNFGMTYEQMIFYFNIGVLICIGLGALFGFLRGMFKSTYTLVVNIGLILLGWFLSPIFVRLVLNYDLSTYGLRYNGGVISTINKLLMDLIANSNANLASILVEGSRAMELYNAFVFMVMRIVILLIWLILTATIFKFFTWIIYLIIKPRKYDKSGKKKKKGFLSRLGGAGVGLAHALIVTLLISIPIAGLTSIGSSLMTVVEKIPVEEVSATEAGNYRLLLSNDQIILQQEVPSLDEYQDMILFMKNYRETYSGKIGKLIKIGGVNFDEYVFDEMFSIKAQNTKVKFRHELEVAVNVYDKIMTALNGEALTAEAVMGLDKEILLDILDDLSNLKLIHVAIPIGLEVVVNTNVLQTQFGELTDIINLEDLLEEMATLNYQKEIENLGTAFIDFLDFGIIGASEPVNFWTLGVENVQSVTNSLSEAKMLQVLGDVALAYLTNLPAYEDFLTKNNIEQTDVNLSEIDLIDEIRNFGQIYQAIVDLGINSLDFNTIDLSTVTDEGVNNLSEVIYQSKLFSNNQTTLGKILVGVLPPEFKEVIVVNNFEKADFVSILSLAVVMINANMFSDDSDPLQLLTEDNIEKIATYISQSNLLSSNIEGLLKMLLTSANLPFEINFPEDISWQGETGKKEFKAILNAASLLFESNLLNNPDFKELSDGTMDTNGDGIVDENDQNIIDELASNLSGSKVIRYNLTNIIDQVVNNSGQAISINGFENPDDWTYEQLYSLLRSVKIVLSKENLPQDLFDLTDEELDIILTSTLVTEAIVDEIIKLANPTDGSEATLIVNLEKDDPRWQDSELRNLFKAGKTILGEDGNINDPNSISIDRILGLTENEIDTLVNSVIIVDTAVNKLDELTVAGGSLYNVLYLPTTMTDYHGSNGELKYFLLAAQIIVNENTTPEQGFSDLQTISLKSVIGENQPTILASKIMRETIIANVEKVAHEGTTVRISPELDRTRFDYLEGTWDAELPKLLAGISIFVGEDGDINNMNFEATAFLSLSDQEIVIIGESKVLSYSIVKRLEDERTNEASYLILPNELNPDELAYNEALWYGENGELTRALKALRELGLSDFNSNISLRPIFVEARGEKEEVILASLVVNATIINKIETEATTGSLVGKLIIPDNIVWDKTYVGDVETDKGELRRFLIAIDILLGENELETATFDVEKFFNTEEHPNRQATLLASRLVEASVVNHIDKEMQIGGTLYETLVYPSNFTDNEWYGETGELRRFLKAIEIIIGDNNFTTATFEVDKFLGPDQEDLLASRLVEASVIKQIKETGKLTIPSNENPTRYYYFEDEELVWERTFDEGELRRFLAGVKGLIGSSKFEDFVFDMNNLLDTDFTVVVQSRVLEETLAKMIEDLLASEGVLTNFIKTPVNGFQWFYHATSQNVDLDVRSVRRGELELTPTTNQYSDLLGFLNSIKEMNGTGLNFNFITIENIVACDSEDLSDALWNYSRIMRGSIATMLNEVVKQSPIPEEYKPSFTDDDFQSQQDVKDGLDDLKLIWNTYFGS